jgi:ABC-type multidrug transport system permease subunit
MISSVATALASHITTQSLYNAVVNVITVPALLFSNTFYPLEVLPPVLRYGAMFNPLTYLNDLLRAILLGAPSTYELASSMFLFIVIAAFGGLECGRSISRQLD